MHGQGPLSTKLGSRLLLSIPIRLKTMQQAKPEESVNDQDTSSLETLNVKFRLRLSQKSTANKQRSPLLRDIISHQIGDGIKLFAILQ